jgi:hypothetical protein
VPASLPADPSTPQVSLTAGLANRFPRQAEEEAAGITGANVIKMQQLAGGVANGTTAAPTSAQTAVAGAQLATDAAGKGAAAGTQAGQLLTGAEQTRQQGAAVQIGNAQQQAATTLAAKQQTNANTLANLSASVNNNLVQRNMQFQSDQIGAGTLNATQLADWTVQNAKDQQQVQDNMQEIQLASQRKLQLYQAVYQRWSAIMQDQQALKDLAAQGYTQEEIAGYTQNAKVQYMQVQAEVAANANMTTGAFTMAGGAIGAVYGGPMGASAGATVGQGVGGAVAGANASNSQ